MMEIAWFFINLCGGQAAAVAEASCQANLQTAAAMQAEASCQAILQPAGSHAGRGKLPDKLAQLCRHTLHRDSAIPHSHQKNKQPNRDKLLKDSELWQKKQSG